MYLSKYSYFLFFSFLFSLVTFHSNAQGVTKNGQSTSSSANFVDKNGKIGSSPVISKDGRVLVLATLTTTAASSVTSTTATSGGNVTSDGGTTITARGVCWATASTPTTAGSKTTVAGTTGSFTSSLTALGAGTTYYVRAYATNSASTSYGNQVTFTTANVPGAPTIGTATAGDAQATVSFTAPASNGGSTITSYTATAAPGGLTGTLSQAGSGTITVSGLTNGTAYTFTVKATNAFGTSVASAASNSVTPAAPLVVGGYYQGGKIFYILQSGDLGYDSTVQHGLIAATTDQSAGTLWYNGNYTITQATGIAVGTGNANTNTIVANQGPGSYAAAMCAELLLGGYSDWYLPSMDELSTLYASRDAVGGFTLDYYWSSTESGANYAYVFGWHNAVTTNPVKAAAYRVRAIRSF